MARHLEGLLEKRALAPAAGQERWAWVGRVAGRKQTLGRYPQMSEHQARDELAYMVGQVRRGDFAPVTPAPPRPEPTEDPPDIAVVVGAFLDNLRSRGVGKAQVTDIEGLLVQYVLRHLQLVDDRGRLILDQDGNPTYPAAADIRVADVEALRDALSAEKATLDRLRDRGITHMTAAGQPLPPGDRSGVPLVRGLGPRRINRAIRSLWRAMDWGASRLGTPSSKPLRDAEEILLTVKTKEGPHLTTGQIHWLLQAAREEELHASRRSRHLARVAPIAVLALGGLRIGELCGLRLMDIDTSRRRWRIHIAESKTSAGERDVPISPYLQQILAEHLDRRRAQGVGPRAPLFATGAGTPIGKDNFRSRQWAATVIRANRLCAEHDERPIPGIDLVAVDGDTVTITPAPEDEAKATLHSLRRSYITHMARLGTHPKKLMKWVGHADSKVTIEIYERVEDDDDDDLDPLSERDPLLGRFYGSAALADQAT